MEHLGLLGKPDPPVLVEAAHRLAAHRLSASWWNDAVVGIRAARRAGFGPVVGVDRTGKGTSLAARERTAWAETLAASTWTCWWVMPLAGSSWRTAAGAHYLVSNPGRQHRESSGTWHGSLVPWHSRSHGRNPTTGPAP